MNNLKMDYNLDRFIKAHEKSYSYALKEIKAGKKRTHWMWYIFPQIAGLGKSDIAQKYAIESLNEARAYLDNEILDNHLIEICQALLVLDTNNAEEIFGFPDNMKLKSSMTLFELADPKQDIFAKVLDKFFLGNRDERTIKLLDNSL